VRAAFSVLACLACLGLLPSGALAANAPRVRLRGSAHLDVHAARDAGKLVLSGTVIDDAGRPAVGARVGVGVAAADARGVIDLAAAMPEPCRGSASAADLARPDLVVVTTDEASRFCLRMALRADHYVAHVEAYPSGLLDGTKVDLPLDLALAPITLRFDPERSVLSLDDDTTTLSVLASSEEEGVTESVTGLLLSISNEKDAVLGTATTDAEGRARFVVNAGSLGSPGEGELRASFGGNARAAPARHAIRVERQTHVDIRARDLADPGVPGAGLPRLPAGSPEDGLTVPLVATPRCLSRGCRAVASGTIEAHIGDNWVVGAAPIDHGEARLLMTFGAPSADTPPAQRSEVTVKLRYLPDAPWFLPGNELVLLQPVRGPSPWTKLPLALAASAVVAWLALARMPMRPRRPRAALRPPLPAPTGQEVEVVRATAGSHGWTGLLTDAHDGRPIGGARIAIERRGFERVVVVVETTSDENGAFQLATIETTPGDELVVDGPLHTRIRRAVPVWGELAVVLVLRKRALLDRLVAWARRQGPPYVMPPDPTPGHVRRVAGADVAVARWASAVEQAAYGGAPVDESTEAEVDRQAPAPDRGADDVDGNRPRSL
jgi:hypothetical protein